MQDPQDQTQRQYLLQLSMLFLDDADDGLLERISAISLWRQNAAAKRAKDIEGRAA